MTHDPMMDQRKADRQAAGLCERCVHHVWIRNDRGSEFLRCRLSDTDPRFARFPALPVLACGGFSTMTPMHTIQPARLKPGVRVSDLAVPAAHAAGSTAQAAGSTALISGRALIVWDPKAPAGTKKLDAIDTDQITPAADCVSESLDTLDERWKAGSFRHLMPD